MPELFRGEKAELLLPTLLRPFMQSQSALLPFFSTRKDSQKATIPITDLQKVYC